MWKGREGQARTIASYPLKLPESCVFSGCSRRENSNVSNYRIKTADDSYSNACRQADDSNEQFALPGLKRLPGLLESTATRFSLAATTSLGNFRSSFHSRGTHLRRPMSSFWRFWLRFVMGREKSLPALRFSLCSDEDLDKISLTFNSLRCCSLTECGQDTLVVS